MARVKREVPIRACRFFIDVNAEVSVLPDVKRTVREGQAVFFEVFSGKRDVIIRIAEVGRERFRFLCLNVDPGVVDISEAAAREAEYSGVVVRGVKDNRAPNRATYLSLPNAARALVSRAAMSEAGASASVKAADVFSPTRCDSASGSLSFLTAVCVAAARSTGGTSSGVLAQFRPLASTSSRVCASRPSDSF